MGWYRSSVIADAVHAEVCTCAGNKGIGYGIAKIFAEEGLRTVVAARNGAPGSFGILLTNN